MNVAQDRAAIHMGNSPCITGLDRGGAHGRRDMVTDGSRTELRPAGFLAVDCGSELADSRSVMEPNRKSTGDNAPEPFSSYNNNAVLKLRTNLCSIKRENMHAKNCSLSLCTC